MKQETFYTIKEMAKHLEMDWETLLTWKYQYLFHLPACQDNNQLKYPTQLEGIFHFIKEAKASGLHDDIIRLWVDKQLEKSRVEKFDLSNALRSLIQELRQELTVLHAEWEQKRILQREYLYTLMENVTWEELQSLQKKCPSLLTLEEDSSVRSPHRSPIWTLFGRANYSPHTN